jgi:hypothetical protein
MPFIFCEKIYNIKIFLMTMGKEKEHKCEESFDYNSLWSKEEKKKEQKIIAELPRGLPRKGIKGKYIKKKGHVGRLQLKRSWGKYFEGLDKD